MESKLHEAVVPSVCGPLWKGRGTPVSSSVLRPLSTSYQPPPAPPVSHSPASNAPNFGAPVTLCVIVTLVTPPLAGSISQVRRVKPFCRKAGIHQHAPGLHELPWRGRLDDLYAIGDDVGDVLFGNFFTIPSFG